jgi:hypothetical protein
MPRKQGVDLTIQITVGEVQGSITLSTPREKRAFVSNLRRASLDELARSMRSDLDEFARLASVASHLSERDRWAQGHQAMRKLRKVGEDVGSSIFRDEDVQEVQEFCRKACRWDERSDDDPRVDLVIDSDAVVPLEFIPFFRRKAAGVVRDARSLDNEARSYLGFAAVVRRKLVFSDRNRGANEAETSILLKGDPDLRARIFQYGGLEVVAAARTR